MKFEIYDEKRETEPVLRLRLTQEYDTHSVRLEAVDRNGDRLDQGSLLTVTPEGVRLHTSVRSEFGFPLDSRGRIRIL